jgi:hypothetical protein
MVRRIILTVLVAGALVGIALSFSSAKRPPAESTSAVEQTFPPAGDLDLRQVTVGVKLATGYTGDLFVDGQQVPEDELNRVPALYQITLQPRPEGQFQLGPGRHCASVRYWRLAQPDDKRDSPPWCFTLH